MEKLEGKKQIHYVAYKWKKLDGLRPVVSKATGKPDPSIPDVIDFLVDFYEKRTV